MARAATIVDTDIIIEDTFMNSAGELSQRQVTLTGVCPDHQTFTVTRIDGTMLLIDLVRKVMVEGYEYDELEPPGGFWAVDMEVYGERMRLTNRWTLEQNDVH